MVLSNHTHEVREFLLVNVSALRGEEGLLDAHDLKVNPGFKGGMVHFNLQGQDCVRGSYGSSEMPGG